MAVFQVLPIAEREPGQYSSPAVAIGAVAATELFVTANISGLDLVNEPATTTFVIEIQKRRDSGLPWEAMVSGTCTGRDGEPVPMPDGINPLLVGSVGGTIDLIRGWQFRVVVTFSSAGDQAKTWGLVGNAHDGN